MQRLERKTAKSSLNFEKSILVKIGVSDNFNFGLWALT
jgi:hypothetical protein